MTTNPQAFISSYPPRLRAFPNPLITSISLASTQHIASLSRTTKRGTVPINYAENEFDDDDFEDSEGPKRPTGLRSRREDPIQPKDGAPHKPGKDLIRPVEIQGIWRDWMGKAKIVRLVLVPLLGWRLLTRSLFRAP
jgi:chromatin structure-remodeling complex subunit SFH1